MEYIRVIKNGIEDDMNKNVWDAIGGDNNKDGWSRVHNAPPEVVEIKSKKKEVAVATPEVVDSPEGSIESNSTPTADKKEVKKATSKKGK